MRHVARPLLSIAENGGSALQLTAIFLVTGALLKFPMATNRTVPLGDTAVELRGVTVIDTKSCRLLPPQCAVIMTRKTTAATPVPVCVNVNLQKCKFSGIFYDLFVCLTISGTSAFSLTADSPFSFVAGEIFRYLTDNQKGEQTAHPGENACLPQLTD